MKSKEPNLEDIAYAVAYAQLAIQFACLHREKDALTLLEELKSHITKNSGHLFLDMVNEKLIEIVQSSSNHQSLLFEGTKRLQN